MSADPAGKRATPWDSTPPDRELVIAVLSPEIPTVGDPGGAVSRYALSGLLVCDGCDLLLHPIVAVDGRRCYRSPCGCRLGPVDAVTVERLISAALDRRGLVAADGVPEPRWPDLFARTLAAVRVGALPDELTFVWRA